MNWNFFKKETSTIEFFSLIPEVVDIAPIKPANQFRPNLIKNATKELSEFKKILIMNLQKTYIQQNAQVYII
jgi:hypothetical protein